MIDKLFQFCKFFGVSGIGWIIDFTIYSIISIYINPLIANIISSFVAIIFVFSVSTRKIFVNDNKYSLKIKFLIYVVYQVVLVSFTSFIISSLAKSLVSCNFYLIVKYSKLLAKIIVTPFSMMCNFIVMRKLIERM